MVIACSQSLYVPSSASETDEHMLTELTLGRKLYIKNCGSCHNLFPPQKYSVEHWTKEMPQMKLEAKITDEQAGLILKYVTGNRPEVQVDTMTE